MTRVLAALAALFALLALRASAGAEPPPPQESPDAAYLAGRAHAVAGDRAYDAGDYRAAAGEYRSAYDLLPLPDLLFNIAQSYRLAGDPRAAVEYYRRYLAIESTGQAADKAREHLAALEKEIAREPALQPTPRPATPRARPLPAAAAAAPAPEPDDRRGRRWLPPVVTGAGVLAAATGAALWISAGRSFDRLESSCAPTCDPDDWNGARDRERAGVALSLSGGAVALAGAVLWVLSARVTF